MSIFTYEQALLFVLFVFHLLNHSDEPPTLWGRAQNLYCGMGTAPCAPIPLVMALMNDKTLIHFLLWACEHGSARLENADFCYLPVLFHRLFTCFVWINPQTSCMYVIMYNTWYTIHDIFVYHEYTMCCEYCKRVTVFTVTEFVPNNQNVTHLLYIKLYIK